jgi:cobalt/nickel transport system ATP-binding protein
MSGHILAARALSFSYPDGTPALRNVSTIFQPGESVAIVGANGAGKSTLLAQFGGVLTPSSGSVTVGETVVTLDTLPQIRRLVGTVFQDANDQLFMPSVFDDVAFGPLNMGLAAEECRVRVQHCLELVGVWHLRDRPPHRLSGGEKRRVAIAAVIAMQPSVMLLDEPTAGLDPRARRQAIGLLAGLKQTRIVATHDLEMVLELCPRAVCLHGGEIVADGDSRDILRRADLLEACGLEMPQSLRACPRCGFAAGE